MQSKVSKGLATWAGIIAALGQYALAVAIFMDTFDQADPTEGLGPLGTATLTLYVVIRGRMDQAQTLANLDYAKWQTAASGGKASPGTTYAGSSPRPHAGGTFGEETTHGDE